MKTNMAKLISDLSKIEANIAKKMLRVSSPPQSPTVSTFSNPPKQNLALKKRDPPKFSGEARDYPRLRKLWKPVEAQFDDANQTEMIKEQVPKNVQLKLKTCQTMEIWTRLESDYGRTKEVALILLDEFGKLTFTSESEHENFIQLYDKLKELHHDLTEIGRAATLANGQW